MKILFCNSNSFPPYQLSGAEETMNDFLEFLAMLGYNVLTINCNERYYLYTKQYEKIIKGKYEEVNDVFGRCFSPNRENFYYYALPLINKYKPDIIFSQLNGLYELSRYAVEKGCKIIYFFHSHFSSENMIISNNEFDVLRSNTVSRIICISNDIRNRLPSELQSKTTVVYPLFPQQKYKSLSVKYKKKRILFFNPIKVKGIEIILSLAKIFKNEEFVIYETWGPAPLKYQQEIDSIPNITLKQRQQDIKKIYETGKIYLLPSLCKEGFGRGIVEANINSIPILASHIGGIPEAAGNEQMTVENPEDIQEWLEKVKLLLYDPSKYSYYKEKALQNSKRFETTNLVEVLEQS
ncbi:MULTISPECIES: glycosyltransferase family 4 protein [unclassified Petrotoga]|uniref:glycosyltransferase family 4 protein n=1 Tax=unclassified Petrotoga TaxID=2620614 RepID=UPI000CA0375B|nr:MULTISPECIES: glycosyltransferase family 4 protein [unclassified Petrotoga]MBL5981525.1 hypothetical protein [Petrotoga sp. 8T1HF07.NaAc.6.1]PNR93879.1 hypothetical protein X926_02540 [Petrotoga sp. HWHPT.55.6.3]